MSHESEWLRFHPALGKYANAFMTFARRVADHENPSLLRETLAADGALRNGEVELRLAESLILDLAEQGWNFSIRQDCLFARLPPVEVDSSAAAKERIRQAHLVERRVQLAESSVREFVRSMEQTRLTKNGWHSIYSLMRDGGELSVALRSARELQDDQREEALAAAVQPYIQFVVPGVMCERTGLALTDVWRYFRMTWVNVHRSTPGRSMMILIRDAASEHHPVIGIAALASSIAQQDVRDTWIGWSAAAFLQQLDREPTTKNAKWLVKSISSLIRGIYVGDLIKDRIVSRKTFPSPTDDAIAALRVEATRQKALHHRFSNAAGMKRREGGWRAATTSHLFRAKRCESLAKLLSIRRAFIAARVRTGTKTELVGALCASSFRTAVGQLIRLVKAERVGIDMLDITVCGAIAPYNHLLGGKLACLLLMSPEVINYYARRYRGQESIIASSMKGTAVSRTPRLVLLCTTSLYGVGSSQYNRVKVPCEQVGGKRDENIEFRRLGTSKGYGSFHLSVQTVKFIDMLLGRREDGRRVNSIFGEGVNPRMRKIREALELLQLPSDTVMNHGNARVVYGVTLAANFRKVLLGRATKPAYLLPRLNSTKTTNRLAAFWRRRWLSRRVNDESVLANVALHTVTYPVSHGARVILTLHQEEASTEY